MVPKETQQVTDSLPKSQSKSDKTQIDSSVMVVASSTNVPEVLIASNGQENLPALREQSSENQVGDRPMPQAPPDEDVNLVEAASTELPLNVQEALIREEDNISRNEFDVILGQVVPEEFASRFPDLSYTLDIQGSASSNQGAQCTWSPSVLRQNITTVTVSSPQGEHWASRTASLGGGVQPSNISCDGPTVNASADTSLPNNPMGQKPRFPSFSDIYDHQLEKLNREQGTLTKNFEEMTAELKAERDKKIAEIQSEYDRKSREVDTEYINQAMKEEVYRSSVVMSSLLSNGFMSKCTDRIVATGIASERASSSQHSTQQQAVQRNMHVNSTAPPRPSVTAADIPIPNLSGPLSHSPRYNTTQPRSQQAVVQSATHMTSTAPPRPSVTAADTPIPNPSGPLSPILRSNTTQPRPISQQATVQSSTPMNSSDLPQPSVTAVEPCPLHSPLNNTPQPRPISQQAMVRSNAQANSTARPRSSITSEALPLHSPLNNMPQPRPPPPLIPNHIPSSFSPASSASPVQGAVRAMAPHLRSSRPPNFAASSSTATNQAPNSAATAASTATNQAPNSAATAASTATNQAPNSAATAASTATNQAPNSAATAASTATNQAPNSAATVASTTNPTSLVQEQQQEKSNSGVVYLSDDE